jgi:hypothetical protein
MQQLTNAEEQWNTLKLEKAFMKDLFEAYPKLQTYNHRYFIKRMIDKQLVVYTEFGTSRILSLGQENRLFLETRTD